MSSQPKGPVEPFEDVPLQEMKEDFISLAEMQRHIMPDPERMQSFAQFDVHGWTAPIDLVGGDYIDFIDMSRFDIHGKMGIVIADASGHGLAAAMLIRDFNTALYTGISFESHYAGDTTSLLFHKINRRMYRSSLQNQYISAFYGEIHLDGKIRYVNAGALSPVILRDEGIQRLEDGGAVLGAFRRAPGGYRVGEAQLGRGDLLIAFTDGITEAANPDGQEFGEERLLEVVTRYRDRSSRKIYKKVMKDVERFCDCARQADDRSLIVIRHDG